MRAAARLTLAGIALFALTLSVHAATYTLANPAGGNWDDVSIWLADGIPAAVAPGTNAGDIVTLTGSGATVTVRTNIPNAVRLQQQCTSCTVDVIASGRLPLADASSVSLASATLRLNGGEIHVVDGLSSAGTLLLRSGQISWSGDPELSGGIVTSGPVVKETNTAVGVAPHISGTGNVTVNGGSLHLTRAAFNSDITVANGATLDMDLARLQAGSNVTGAGTVILDGLNTDEEHRISGTYAVENTIIRGPSETLLDVPVTFPKLTLPGNVSAQPILYGAITVTDTLAITRGFIQGNLTIAASATATLNSGGFSNGTLLNHGDVNQVGGSFDFDMATIDNRGSWETARLLGEGQFLNSGTLEISPVAEVSSVNIVNSGTVNVDGTLDLTGALTGVGFRQTAGVTTIDGGILTIERIQLEGGTLRGSGTLYGLVNGGTLAPGIGSTTGRITIEGFYTQTASGTLDVELAGTTAGSEYDQLVITTSTAPENAISGTLDADLIDGFVPADGDSFDVIAFQHLNGDFTTKNLPSEPNVTFTTQKLANAYRLLAQVDAPDLTVESSASPAATAIDEHVEFEIVVANDGTSTASAVSLANVLSGGTVVDVEASQGTCSGTSTVSCSLGTIAPGASATVNIIVTSSTAQTVTVTSTASTTGDTNTGNNSDSASAEFQSGSDLAIAKTGPPFIRAGNTFTYTIRITNNGPSAATNVVVSDPTPAQLTFVDTSGACTTPFPCNLGTLESGATRVINARYTVTSDGTRITNVATVATSSDDPVASNNSATERTTILRNCTTAGPELLEPANGSNLQPPVTFRWTAVTGATRYLVFASTEGEPAQIGESATTSFTAVLPDGVVTWYVVAELPECGAVASELRGQFRVCTASLGAPVLEGPAVVSKGSQMGLEWSAVPGAVAYQLDQATDPNFVDSFTHVVTFTTWVRSGFDTVGDYFYRVRAISACGTESPSSGTHRVVVVPQNGNEVVVNVAGGTAAELSVHVDGFEGAPLPFQATTDAEWLTVTPATGDLPTDGRNLAVRVSGLLFNGTHIATLIVTTSAGERRIPITVHAVSSVRNVAASAPTAESLVIPVVGHLRGANSHWQSDVRIANLESNAVHRYALTLISGTARETVILARPRTTVALDDIAKNWFGVGALDDDGSGMLQIRPLDGAPRPLVTSRTYNVTENGTLGQSVPALASDEFIGNDGAILTLQQLAQSAGFRTNLGLVEGFGAPASVLVTILDANGTNLHEQAVALQPFQQLQLNGFLGGHGIQSDNARIEVRVTSGSGRVAAYASVVDNTTNDPLLVSAVRLGTPRANRYVFAGAADLMSAAASWRTDLRLFNSTAAPQIATLTFHPFGGAATAKETTVQPGQVLAFDSVLRSFFGLHDTGGTVHVTTANESNLVLTGRTYDQREHGTYGQFIEAFLPSDAASLANGRKLQLVHVEDSPRYRSNLGIAETSGQAVSVQVEVLTSDGNPRTTFNRTLAPFALLQFRAIRDLGLGDLYNARITVRVTGGEGSVVAYASVVDNRTQDPTYVSAQ